MLKIKQDFPLNYANIWHQLTLNLLGEAENKYYLIGKSFNEVTMLPYLQAANNGMSLFATYLAKAILCYLFNESKEAIAKATTAAEYSGSGTGMAAFATHNFYYSLALLAECDRDNKQYIALVESNQEKMRKWTEYAPMNYQHKYDLVEAEKARVLGKTESAMAHYDLAIAGANSHGYLQEESLGNELAARFYLAIGKAKIAKIYMTDAYYGYIRWGAIAKVRDLEERYPHLIIRSYSPTALTSDTTKNNTIHSTTTSSSTTSNSKILDLATVMKAAEAIASEIVLDKLLGKLLNIILENAGAKKGCLILEKDRKLFIEAIYTSQHDVTVQSTPVETSLDIPVSLIYYVARTQQPLVLNDASQGIQTDPYIQRHQPKSLLCAPIFNQGKFTGIFYMENNLVIGAFTPDRLELLKMLTSQAAIAIDNARLYAREQERSQQLQQSLQKLQQTQAKLVQTEKISSLGQLVAGVAHEVNNPVSFISTNLSHANQYIDNLLLLLRLYQQYLPSPPAEIQDAQEAIDLDFLLSDLPKMISSMKLGTNRIREIMQSLRNFSRADGVDKKAVDIHQGLDTTLMILQHRLKASPNRPAIQIVKEYGNLPQVECFGGQLNQVFMNLLANAIDAMDESNHGKSYVEIERNPNVITIRTSKDDGCVTIRIADNGSGMSDEVRQRLFDPFFTTKQEGKGTGLGLSISHQIVTEAHGGTLQCISCLGKGTQFVIQIPLS